MTTRGDDVTRYDPAAEAAARAAEAVAWGQTVAQAADALGELALAWNMSPMRRAMRRANDEWRRMPWWRKVALYLLDGGGAREAWMRRRLCELLATDAPPPDDPDGAP